MFDAVAVPQLNGVRPTSVAESKLPVDGSSLIEMNAAASIDVDCFMFSGDALIAAVYYSVPWAL